MSKQPKPSSTPIREKGLNPSPPPRERDSGGNQGINPSPPPKK